MGVLADVGREVERLRVTGGLEESFDSWRENHSSLASFGSFTEWATFVADRSHSLEECNSVIWPVCIEAKNKWHKTEDGARAPSVEIHVLLWLFTSGLRRAIRRAPLAGSLDSGEIEAEVVAGFWEKVTQGELNPDRLCGDLVLGALHKAWEVARRHFGEFETLESLEEVPAIEEALPNESPEWSDPWMVLCYAVVAEVVSEAEAELIFWTRLKDEPLDKVSAALGLNYDAGRQRRSRAERALTEWVTSSSMKFPPREPKVRIAILEVARKLSEVPKFAPENLSQNSPESCS